MALSRSFVERFERSVKWAASGSVQLSRIVSPLP